MAHQLIATKLNIALGASGVAIAATLAASDLLIDGLRKEEYFGYQYTGYIYIPEEEVYEFSTVSDDGSNLYVDGKKVVDNNGLHSSTLKCGTVPLAQGLHAIRIDYFEQTGGNELKVFCRKSGDDRRPIPSSWLLH